MTSQTTNNQPKAICYSCKSSDLFVIRRQIELWRFKGIPDKDGAEFDYLAHSYPDEEFENYYLCNKCQQEWSWSKLYQTTE